jgi:short-subunit dehydrogenase
MSDEDFSCRYGRWAMIAGGSEGVGAAFARRLAGLGLDLLLIARKVGPLETLAAEIRTEHGREVRILSADLTAPDALSQIIVAADGCDIGMFIYNAGSDLSQGNFVDRSLADSERLMALNVTTPLRITRHFAPAMVDRGSGGIILVSSVSGSAGTPGGAVYSASKAFSNVFAEALWHELGEHGVDVLGLVIGLTRTPAVERLGLRFDGALKAAEPEEHVTEALAHLKHGPTHHAGGTHDDSLRLRAMPRAEAVRAIAAMAKSVR